MFRMMDLFDETRTIAIRSHGVSTLVEATASYHAKNTGVLTLVIARHLVFFVPLQAKSAACDAPMDSRGDHTFSVCSSGPVSRGHRYGSLTHVRSGALLEANLLSKREKCGQWREGKGGPTTAGLLISKFYHRFVKALEHTRWRRRLISLLNRAIRRRGSVACSAPVRAGGRICGHSCGDPQDIRLSQPRCV
jgi:hypothetical protein